MKKSLLALAVLGAFAGAASAQSSVTLYGRVDLSVGKNAGSAQKVMQNGSGSRLGLRGVEDLGGGTKAFFNIEHRYNADTGADTSGNVRFWGGRSLVGLEGGFGRISLGREYTTAFLGSQLIADPWGWDTVAASTGTVGITGLGIAAVRNDSSLTYNLAAGGLRFGAQIAEATDTINRFQKKPVNFNLGYAAGPVGLHFGYERTGAEGVAAAKIMTLGGSMRFGGINIGAFYGKGNTAADDEHTGYMLTATTQMGQGEFRFAAGKRDAETARGATIAARQISLLAVGYHYALSKRTTLYADFARNGKLATEKAAYDFGIKHNF
jgi:predicted porin